VAARAGRRTVALISAFDAPFIEEDAAVIGSGPYSVTRLTGNGPSALVKAAASALRADLIFCWFLSVYGAVAVIAAAVLGRRSLIVLGGVDVARDRDLGYGLWLSPWKSFLARSALRRADRVLVVAEHLRGEAMELARYGGENIRYLPTGYDPGFWSPGVETAYDQGTGRPRGGVLCVAGAESIPRLKVKGVDLLIAAARLLPETPFTVVGVPPALAAPLDPPTNVTFVPAVERARLLGYYREARVYCQPSRREGLPNALCEAMLCGCVPAVTDAGASVHAVGDAGFVARSMDPASIADAIGGALSAPAALGGAARERIISLFPATARREGLLTIMGELG